MVSLPWAGTGLDACHQRLFWRLQPVSSSLSFWHSNLCEAHWIRWRRYHGPLDAWIVLHWTWGCRGLVSLPAIPQATLPFQLGRLLAAQIPDDGSTQFAFSRKAHLCLPSLGRLTSSIEQRMRRALAQGVANGKRSQATHPGGLQVQPPGMDLKKRTGSNSTC